MIVQTITRLHSIGYANTFVLTIERGNKLDLESRNALIFYKSMYGQDLSKNLLVCITNFSHGADRNVPKLGFNEESEVTELIGKIHKWNGIELQRENFFFLNRLS